MVTNCVGNVAHSSVDVSLRPKRVVGCDNRAGAQEIAQIRVHALVPKSPCASVHKQHDSAARLWAAAGALINVAEAARALCITHVPVIAGKLPTDGRA